MSSAPSDSSATALVRQGAQTGLARQTLAHEASVLSLRDDILASAGVDKARLSELARKAVTRIDEAMDAIKVTHHTFEGEVVEDSYDVDHRARMDGVDRALDLFGGRVSKSATSQPSAGPTQVNVFIAGPNGHEPVHVDAVEVQGKPA